MADHDVDRVRELMHKISSCVLSTRAGEWLRSCGENHKVAL